MTCPVCGDHLRPVDRALQCPQHHNFDQAREGYFHLLPAGRRGSRLRGDTSEMLRARMRTLERGFFEPLASTILDCIQPAIANIAERTVTILEAGCGTGYYIGQVAKAVEDRPHCLFGIDVSRDAVRLAARRHPTVEFLVNNLTHRLCFATASVQVLLNIFAPRNSHEFARVLHPVGSLVTVIPGPQHMIELRTDLPLLRIEPEKTAYIIQQFSDSFAPFSQQNLTYRRTAEGIDAGDLLCMGPNYWHLDAQQLARARALPQRELTFDFVILVFRRKSLA